MQVAFNKMRMLMVADTLAAYPDHNKWFDVDTYASDYQLGMLLGSDIHVINEHKNFTFDTLKMQ
ncbi:hypothetical protein ACHAW6_001345 [Cyclotella cf. meneghiniana]